MVSKAEEEEVDVLRAAVYRSVILGLLLTGEGAGSWLGGGVEGMAYLKETGEGDGSFLAERMGEARWR